MRITKSLGSILLAIWLILTGLMQLMTIAIPGVVMAVLAHRGRSPHPAEPVSGAITPGRFHARSL